MMQRRINAETALRKVAKVNHTSIEDVKKEIRIAIDAAMANPDPSIQALWQSMPRSGEKPTPEEFIAFIVSTIISQNDTVR